MKKYIVNEGHSLSFNGKVIKPGQELKQDVLSKIGKERMKELIAKKVLLCSGKEVEKVKEVEEVDKNNKK